MHRRVWLVIGTIALFILIFGGALVRLYTDWLWFGEVGYRTVYWTRLTTRAWLGLVGGVIFFGIVYTNLWLARRLAPPVLHRYDNSTLRIRMSRLASRGFNVLILVSTLGASILAGLETSTHWLSYQMFASPTPFGQVDPIFHRDIGFYIFKLDFLRYIYGWLFFAFVVATIATAAVHYVDRAIEFLAGMPTFAPHVKAHLSFLVAAALFIKAWGYRLDAYDLLFSPTGVVFGAGYTDVHARLAAYKILPVVAVIAGILALVNIQRRGIALPAAALVILIGSSLILGVIYPSFVQQIYVMPNEIARESKYIAYNIRSTREAFNLDGIQRKNFPALPNLTAEDIESNRPTINSIRLWDYRPLDKTYSQLQELGPYYDISFVDVDRYTINGEIRQVTLAAREISLENARAGTATWVNRHFQYTHGYGAVMSPVNKASNEGLPQFFVEGIPPKSSVGIEIDRPQIYFGQMTNDYVIVNSGEKEFDYPSEGRPMYARYSGIGGIPVGGYLQRLAFSWRFSDLKLVLKNPITAGSRLMFRRNIGERVGAIFPFLYYDPDPYLVISDGKLYWMWDAYTVSRRYPYSRPHEIRQGSEVNYIRNAAKVVVDARHGTVSYYISDEEDPIIKTYEKIFPGTFKPMSEMPADLRAHVRYPELLFRTQAHVLLTYHMQSPQVFYNRGDLWDIPREIVETSGEQTPMEPYYVVMRLPGEKKEEFLQIIPFTPVGKDNMVAWMAVRSDPSAYGQMVLYQFPTEKLVYGPALIESRINQDSVISPQLTLWNQHGSQVNRGNLLVIPVEQSIIYVKPIYLESNTSKMPELKRVIIAFEDQLVMEETLDAALTRLFGSRAAPPSEVAPLPRVPSPPPGTAISSDMRKLINQAVSQLERAQELQRKGDWAGYGEQLRRLEETLRRLRDAPDGAGSRKIP